MLTTFLFVFIMYLFFVFSSYQVIKYPNQMMNVYYVRNTYIVESLFLMKLMIFAYMTLLSIYVLHLNPYDMYFIDDNFLLFQLFKHVFVLLSLVYVVILFLLGFGIVGNLFYGGFEVKFTVLSFDFIFFVFYYFCLIVFSKMIKEHLFMYFLPFMMFLVVGFSLYSDEFTVRENFVHKVIYFFVFDIHFSDSLYRIYDYSVYVSILLLMYVVLHLFKKTIRYK